MPDRLGLGRWGYTVALSVSALLACDQLRTASGEYGVSFADFHRLPDADPYLVLDGTRLCEPSVRCGPCEGDAPRCQGAVLEVSGAEPDDLACTTAQPGAPLTYTFTPTGCAETLPSEALRVAAVALDQVTPVLTPDIVLRSELGSDLAYEPFDLSSVGARLPGLDELRELALLAGAPIELSLRLYDEGGRRVGWNPSAGELSHEVLAGPAPAIVAAESPVTHRFTLAEGAQVRATYQLYGEPLPLAELTGVGAAALASIDLTAILLDAGADGQQPFMIQAQVRDTAGRLVYGVPLEWRVVEGDLLLETPEEPSQTPWISAPECIPKRPAATRAGRVEAAYGELRGAVDFTWKGYTGADPYNAGPCEGEGCGCRTGLPSPQGALLAFLLAPLLVPRRRGRSPR